MADCPTFWRRRGLVACLLWPLSLLFRLLVALRRFAYRRGWLCVYRAPVAVVVVGNLTVGGNGKTPLVIALAQHLQRSAIACAVVSRGYGGTVRGVTEVLPHSDAAVVGDEPLLIRRQADVPVFVAAKRSAAVQAVLAHYPNTQLILCDDGLQHYALARDMEIVVMAADLRIGNGWMLPAGPLREPPSRLEQIDALVISHGQAAMEEPYRDAYHIAAHSDGVYPLQGGTLVPWTALTNGQPLYLLTAIARPQRVIAMLKQAGIELTASRLLGDHAALTADDAAFAADGYLFITGKDAVKTATWPSSLRARTWVIDYRLDLPDALLNQVRNIGLNHQ